MCQIFGTRFSDGTTLALVHSEFLLLSFGDCTVTGPILAFRKKKVFFREACLPCKFITQGSRAAQAGLTNILGPRGRNPLFDRRRTSWRSQLQGCSGHPPVCWSQLWSGESEQVTQPTPGQVTDRQSRSQRYSFWREGINSWTHVHIC